MNRLIPKVCLVALIAVTGCASSGTKTELKGADRAKYLLDIGNGALLEGDASGALANFLEAENYDPALPELHHSKALAYFAKRDRSLALKSARRAVLLKPDYSAANMTLGKLLMDREDYDSAEKYLRRAAKDHLNREAYKALTSLGVLYYKTGKSGKAREEFDRAVLAGGESACVAYYFLGHLEADAGNYGKAAKEYDRATRGSCATFPDAHFALGMTYVKGRQFSKARAKFLEVQKLYPDTKIAEKAVEQLRHLP